MISATSRNRINLTGTIYYGVEILIVYDRSLSSKPTNTGATIRKFDSRLQQWDTK